MKYQAESYDGKIITGIEIRYYGVTPFLVLEKTDYGYREIKVKQETIKEIKNDV